MIDVKQAVQIAKEKAGEVLGRHVINLEEIERQVHNGRDVWSVTFSFPREGALANKYIQLLPDDLLQYKRFLIDSETGEFLAMKIREVATQ